MIINQGKNPSFHAYLMAKYLIRGGNDNIRILSLSPNERKVDNVREMIEVEQSFGKLKFN